MTNNQCFTRREWLRSGAGSAVALTMGVKLAECAAAANPAGESPQEPLLKRLIEMGMDNMLRWTFMMAKGDPETVVKQGTHPLPITFADGAHNIVRVIDALLFGEAVAGKRIPPQAEDVLRHWLYVLLDNPTHLMAKFMPEAGQELVHAHDSRETVLALTALIRYRDDDRARQYARKFLERLLGLTRPDGTFNAEEIAKHPRLTGLWTRFSEQTKDPPGKNTACVTRGRAIDALCKYYRVTQEDQALELAGRFVRLVRRTSFMPDGKINPNELGHTHSITATVHGLIDFGLLTGDREVFEHGRRIFDVGLPAVSSSFGWSRENAWGDDGPPRPWRGELNNTGDMIQAALWLARSGLPQYFEDAERRIRSHIVPSQCTHDTEDQGWGVPAPSDREGGSGTKSVVDITAGVVQALCATTETLVTKDDKGQSVNLAFSNWKGPVRVRSGLPEEWRLEITPDEQGNVRVRIPSWADRSKLRVNVEGQQRRAAVENAWLVLEDIPAGATVAVAVPLAERETTEVIKNLHNGKERTYRIVWRGDQVVAMSPKGTVVPMYPSVEEYRAGTAER